MSRSERKARREAREIEILDAWVAGINKAKGEGIDVNSMSGKKFVLFYVNDTVPDFNINDTGHMAQYLSLVQRSIRVLNKIVDEDVA